ncbi:hypothetical protein M1446_04645 [Candidatus Dependentiae bacterium]|nr:hypothetical protein [Candidatus Dependentiae bacterium]
MNKLFFLGLISLFSFSLNCHPIPDGAYSPYVSHKAAKAEDTFDEIEVKAGCFYIYLSQIKESNKAKNSGNANAAKNFCLAKSIVIEHKDN